MRLLRKCKCVYARLSQLVIGFLLIACTTTQAYAAIGDVLWTVDISNVSGSFITVGPDGTIYTTDNNRLWAINPDGTVKWTFDAAGGEKPVSILPDGRIVTGFAHTIWALHPDGTVDWSFSWAGKFNNQLDNGPSIGPDGNIYATTPVNDGLGMGAFSLTSEGQLRWQDDPTPSLVIFNVTHKQRMWFTNSKVVFGFLATSGTPMVYAYDFDGNHTAFMYDFWCTSSPRSNPNYLLLAGLCGVQAIDLNTNNTLWNIDFGQVNVLPISSADGVVYSGNWFGPLRAISEQGSILWTSPQIMLKRPLIVSETNNVVLFAGENFGQPHWLGALDKSSGNLLWTTPLGSVAGLNEFLWSLEAALSPQETVAYFTTRFGNNGAAGRVYAVQIADTSQCLEDLDGNNQVGITDLLQAISVWGPCANCSADFDNSGDVGISDLLVIISAWGTCPL